jgi:hypothetical protein
MVAYPTGESPSTSSARAMVLAVYWPPQAPLPGQAAPSSSASFAADIRPAAWAPTALEHVLDGDVAAFEQAGANRSAVEQQRRQVEASSAIAAPGSVLSQPTRATMPSKRWPRPTSSIESAMTSRLTSEAFIPSVPMVTPSLMAMVSNSIGVAPASRMPFFTCSASRRRWKLQGMVSVQVLATPISGRARSSG